MIERTSSRGLLALVLALFFGSGALALVYQVVWARMMTHVFGSTAVAVGTVLAAFMAGMAFGSWYLGKVADRSSDRLKLYAVLEFGIAAAALLSHFALSYMDAFYPTLYGIVGGSSALLAPARFLAAFLLVMAPTILMGATLPVLSRYLVSGRELVGVRLSTLYSVNTFGAVVGAGVTGFFLIGSYGIHAPVIGAAIGNALIGLVAWLAAGRHAGETEEGGTPPPEDDRLPEAEADAPGPAVLRVVLIGLAISGFTSFAYEIYWTRSLVFVLGNSTYALSTMLCAFLTGIALGGYLVRYVIRHVRDRVEAFGWLQLALGLVSALALPLLFAVNDPASLERYLQGVASEAATLVLASFGVAFLVMLVPAALIGATFPLVGHLAVRRISETGGSVGRVYAVNTLGNVVGALAPGLFLLDRFGIQGGILFMAALNVLLGLVILGLRLLRPAGNPVWWGALPALLIASVFVMSQAPLDFRFPSRGEQPDHRTLFYREGPLATTKVYADPGSGEKYMSVDGIVIGGTGDTHFKQVLLAHLPRLLADDLATELSVGLGSGILVGESARHEDLRAITAVEIEPGVIEGAGYFREEHGGVLGDTRLEIVNDDINSFLHTSERNFDVITADEKTADEYASNGFSYSLDYYRLLLEHLKPGGLVVQWVPGTLPPRQYRMILKTFARGFPHVQVWSFLPAHRLGPFNTLLVGSAEPVPVELDAIRRRFADHGDALASLVPYGITSAESLVPHFVAGDAVIRRAVADAELNTLAYPRYEFYHPWEYAEDRLGKAIANQGFLLELKRRAHPDYFRALAADADDPARLKRTFEAEFRFLEAFRRFLGRIPLAETYRLFDGALATAPWHDSLRARIYAQYRYFAASQRDPVRRAQLARRAEALYRESRDVPRSGREPSGPPSQR